MTRPRKSRTSWLAVPLVLVAAAATLAFPQDRANAGAQFSRCGDQPHDGAGWYNVRAKFTRCHKARHLARHYWQTWKHHPDHRYHGWKCGDRQKGEELWKGRCTRPHRTVMQVVKFEFGF